MHLRTIPGTSLSISPVAFGCWPISGISSLEVDDAASQATIEAAFARGINHFDTAYSYGYDGRSDRILRRALANRMEQVVIASKVGSHYTPSRERVLDSSPDRLRSQADEIRQRLGLDRIDLLYLHAPDGKTPIERAAETLAQLQSEGKIRYACLSNGTPEETMRFASVIQPVLLQPSFNMLQQEKVVELASCIDSLNCGVAAYWPLMKGLLAGKLTRDYPFDPKDRRLSYPIFQGLEWQRNQDFMDRVREIASSIGWSIPRLVIRWTMNQPRITTVLCGAKRPEQIQESADAMIEDYPEEIGKRLDKAIRDRTTMELHGN